MVVVYAYAGFDGAGVERQIGPNTRGIVVAGVGEGNMSQSARHALVAEARRGLPVVRASRADEGLVDREPEDTENGFIAARALNPQKARILLQLLLAGGITDPAPIQAAFDRR